MATTSNDGPPDQVGQQVDAMKASGSTTRDNGATGTQHPFAASTAKLELLPPDTLTASGIDIEEEARLYDELCEAYENEVRTVSTVFFCSKAHLIAQFTTLVRHRIANIQRSTPQRPGIHLKRGHLPCR